MSLKKEKKFDYVVKYRPRNIYFENREGTYIGRMSISSKRLISAICIIIAFGMSLVVIQLTYVTLSIYLKTFLGFVYFFILLCSLVILTKAYTRGWIINLEEDSLYIENGINKYFINIKNILNVTMEDIFSTNIGMVTTYIKIEFIRKNKVKNMLFLVNDETIMKKSSHYKERLNPDDEARFADAQTFVDTFINKGQLAKQKDANTYNEYVDIRTEEENKEIERIYTKYNKNIMRKKVSPNVAYLSAIVIPIIGCIIYGILAFCNVF